MMERGERTERGQSVGRRLGRVVREREGRGGDMESASAPNPTQMAASQPPRPPTSPPPYRAARSSSFQAPPRLPASQFSEGTCKKNQDGRPFISHFGQWVALPEPKNDEEDVGCALCSLPEPAHLTEERSETATKQGTERCYFSGDRSRLKRRARLELHPYLFDTVSEKLCSFCAHRVRFTREACRVISRGGSIKSAEDIGAWIFPSMWETHKSACRTPSVRVASGETTRESICAVCSQEEDRTQDSDCESRCTSCETCGLLYHNNCLQRIFRTKSEPYPSCPVCQGLSRSPQVRQRLFDTGYTSVQNELQIKSKANCSCGAAGVPGTQRPKRPRKVEHTPLEESRDSATVVSRNCQVPFISEAGRAGVDALMRLCAKPTNSEPSKVQQTQTLLGKGGQCVVIFGHILDEFEPWAPSSSSACAQLAPNTAVAIKRLPRESDPKEWRTERIILNEDSARRLRNEAMLLQLAHGREVAPNLVRFLGFDENCDELYLVKMHVSVKGFLVNLRSKRYKTEEELKSREVIVKCSARALLAGVAHLHKYGIFHRDIKADNLLLEHAPTSPAISVESIKICDLGFSYHSETNPEAKDDLPGTLPYFAPEVLCAREERTAIVKEVCLRAIRDQIITGKEPGFKSLMSKMDVQMHHVTALEGAHAWRKDIECMFKERLLHSQHQIVNWVSCDTWCCGIVVWELFNCLAPHPYPGCEHKESQLIKHIRNGTPPQVVVASTDVPCELKETWERLVESEFFHSVWDQTERAAGVGGLLDLLDL